MKKYKKCLSKIFHKEWKEDLNLQPMLITKKSLTYQGLLTTLPIIKKQFKEFTVVLKMLQLLSLQC